MYTHLTYNGVKGISNSIELDRVTVVTGPNESGKSAAANALQLAVTGRCEIGSQASAQAKLLASNAASVTAWGNGLEASWSLRNGKKQWEDPGTQGGMPVSVEDFWALTGVERLKLIAPAGALTSIESRIAALEAEKKQLKTVIDAPAPMEPDAYDGEPISVLENKIQTARQALNDHNTARKAMEAASAGVEQLKSLKARQEEVERSLVDCELQIGLVSAELDRAKSQLAIYQESSSKEPRIIASARERRVSVRAAVSDTLKLVREAVAFDSGLATLKFDEAVDSFVGLLSDGELAESPDAVFHAVNEVGIGLGPVAKAVQLLNDKKNQLSNTIAMHKGTIADTSSRIVKQSQVVAVDETKILPEDNVLELHGSISEMDAEISKAKAWSHYEAALTKQMEARGVAFNKMASVDDELSKVKNSLTAEVDKLKGPIENKANEMLKAASQAGLSVEVSQSGRGWVLDVSIDGVAIESLARSKRLLYGLCLLSAIHELSEAKAPLLVAECAEMDDNTLERAIEAMKVKRKGNVILEHWSKPRVDVCLIDLSTGVLI
jgi:energy-coupling factor transporter ATP-binding protein EcfA2